MNTNSEQTATLHGLIDEIADEICRNYCKFAKENETDEEYNRRMADHCSHCPLTERL